MADEDGHFRGETLDLLLHDLDDDILDREFEEQIAIAVVEVGMDNEVNKLYAFFLFITRFYHYNFVCFG